MREHEELAALLIADAECLEVNQPDLMSLTNHQLRRAAALLREARPQPVPVWQPIDTAPQDGSEILASDYDVIEIVNWNSDAWGNWDWSNRDGSIMFPTWWQPLPDHPPTPQPPQSREVGQ